MDAVNRRTLLVAALAAAGGTLTGCTPAEVPPATSSPTVPSAAPSPSPTPTIERPRAPLTGRVLLHAEALDHPAVAIKVPNLQREYPQLGLDAADIVVVQPNGPSYTRFNAIFHSQLPAAVNPIRSMRPVDVPTLAPIRPLFGNTGAIDWVVNYVDHYAQFIERMSYMDMRGTGAYGIDSSRVYTINGVRYFDKAVIARPAEMVKLAKRMTAPPPQPYLPFAASAEAASTVSGKVANRIDIPYGPAHTYDMSYSYHPATNRYRRFEPWGPHVLANGVRVAVDNVLVVRAKWDMGKIYAGRGGTDPVVHIIEQRGKFHYLNGGRYVTGTWAKGAVEDLFEFTLDDGSPLQVAPGVTWIELPQVDAKLKLS